MSFLSDFIKKLFCKTEGQIQSSQAAQPSAPVLEQDELAAMQWEDAAIIRAFEGCSLKAYPDPATGGKPITIGWGSTRYPNGKEILLCDSITQIDANMMLMHEATKTWNKVRSLVKVKITRNQLAALTSFAYNVGLGNLQSSTLLKMLNNGAAKEDVAAQFLRWNKANGKVMAGLTRRRASEKDLFLKP